MRVNSLVELINDKWEQWVYQQIVSGHIKELPVKGPIYTVREIRKKDNGQSILLEEIINPAPKGMGEVVFLSERFRELMSPDELSISELLKNPEVEYLDVIDKVIKQKKRGKYEESDK